MRHTSITLMLAAVATVSVLSACGSKEDMKEKEMNTISFDSRQAAAVAVVACHEARGDQSSLATALDEAFDAGLTVNQLKEVLSQLYAYTGFPRSLNALGTLQKVMERRGVADQGDGASPMPAGYDALRQGTAVQTRLSGQPFDYAFCPAEDYYLKVHLFGDIFARDVLTHAERELVTVSALSGLEGVMPQLQAHVRGALNMGVGDTLLAAIPGMLRAAGLEAEALRCQAAIESIGGKPQTVSPSAFPLGASNDAYAQYFKGQSYLAVLDSVSGLCNVTFEPGCRNNWHVHHQAVQVLTCVSGRGWYQEWGKPAVELRPGTVVSVPAGTKHWHGAAADSWMQHLAYFANQQPGFRNEWLEPVDDKQYQQVNQP